MIYCEGCGMVDTDWVEFDYESERCYDCVDEDEEIDAIGTFFHKGNGKSGLIFQVDRFSGRVLAQYDGARGCHWLYTTELHLTFDR
jgi:hypothetical protein